MLAALCYAELSTRVPRAGSAYVYTYVMVGELCAFVIGWNLILEYAIGTASIARTFTGYLDYMVGDKIVPWFSTTLPIDLPLLAPYFDLVAVGVILFITAILIFGVKESVRLNNVLTAINLFVLTFIIFCGFFEDDIANWNLSETEVPNATIEQCSSLSPVELSTGCCQNHDGCGDGGFAPYGVKGIISGAATCFFAFVGFDVIATTGEETTNPKKSIPIAIIASLTIICCFYTGVSLTVTMIVPYYTLKSGAPFARAFASLGWVNIPYAITAGALCALTTAALSCMFSNPRVVFSMGRDRLLFGFLSYVNERLKTPVTATLISGVFTALMAGLLDVEALVEMMSIGTLLAYTLVAACVILIRCDSNAVHEALNIRDHSNFGTFSSTSTEEAENPVFDHIDDEKRSLLETVSAVFSPPAEPTKFSANSVKILTFLLTLTVTVLALFCTMLLSSYEYFVLLIIASVIFLLIAVGIGAAIYIQPQHHEDTFEVPFVPLVPALSIFFNIYLMFNLSSLTWLRFLVWMALGFIIYFTYGIRNSLENVF